MRNVLLLRNAVLVPVGNSEPCSATQQSTCTSTRSACEPSPSVISDCRSWSVVLELELKPAHLLIVDSTAQQHTAKIGGFSVLTFSRWDARVPTSESSRADVPLGAAAAPDMIGFGVLVLALEGVVASAIEINIKVVAFVADVGQLCKNAVKPRARDQQQTIRREFNGCPTREEDGIVITSPCYQAYNATIYS